MLLDKCYIVFDNDKEQVLRRLQELNFYMDYESMMNSWYTAANYSEHYKYENYFNGYDFIQTFTDKPTITIDKIGEDFEDFFVWTNPQITQIITGKGREKLLNSEFFSSLK